MSGKKGSKEAEDRARGKSEDKRKVIIILEKASLETVKTKKGYELLNCDDHRHVHKKMKRDFRESRPDITHQVLLTLLDSPLNKAGFLQVYIHTSAGVLIEVNPHIRIPRTFKRFCGLMVQLLHKMKIRAADGPDVLLKVVKNPVTRHLPAGARKIGTSMNGKLIKPSELVPKLPQDGPVVFCFGAMSHGFVDDVDWLEESYSFSQYPLSASYAIGRLLNAYEDHWGIL
eukprot:g1245.t1